MSKEPTGSLDGYLETLEKRARVARTLSVVITIGTIALAAIVLFFTIREIRKRINQEQAALETLTQERINAERQRDAVKKELEVAIQQRDLYLTAVENLPKGVQEEALNYAALSAFAVIRNFRTLEEASAYARELSKRGLPYPVEIYRRDVNRYYVTLGGNLSNTEARKRVAYARQAGLATDAYQKNAADLGQNLYRR